MKHDYIAYNTYPVLTGRLKEMSHLLESVELEACHMCGGRNYVSLVAEIKLMVVPTPARMVCMIWIFISTVTIQ